MDPSVIRSALERVTLVRKDESGLAYAKSVLKDIGSVGAIKATHYGENQYWHAMDSGDAKTNLEVRDRIFARFQSLYEESRKVSSEKRYWYYGSILHTLQDGHSDAHVARAMDVPDMPIHFFQNYKQQEGGKHGVADADADAAECEQKFETSSMEAGTELTDMYKNTDIKKIKERLYKRSAALSEEFLRIVRGNRARPGHKDSIEAPAPDIWESELLPFFEKAFAFDTRKDWTHAAPGGSLPLYAKSVDIARGRNQFVPGKREEGEKGEFTIKIESIKGSDFMDKDYVTGGSDVYLSISVGNYESVKTEVKENFASKANAEWKVDQEWIVSPGDIVRVEAFDSDDSLVRTHSEKLGYATWKVSDFQRSMVGAIRRKMQGAGVTSGFLSMKADVSRNVDSTAEKSQVEENDAIEKLEAEDESADAADAQVASDTNTKSKSKSQKDTEDEKEDEE
jgi:hypothetical protein